MPRESPRAPALAAALVAALLVGAGPTRAAAQDGRAEATPIFEEGVALAEAGSWAEALSRFERAYALYPHVNIRLNLAAAQAETGRLLASIATYEALLEELRATPRRRRRRGPDPDTVSQALTRVRERVPLLAVAVASPQPGDVVRIDDVAHELSTLGEGIALDPGEHMLAWVRAGEVLASQTLTLREGGTETLRLEVAPPAQAGGGGGTEPSPATGGGDDATLTIVGAVLIGVGAAALGGMGAAMALIDGYSGDATLLAYRAALPPGTFACTEAQAGADHGQGEEARLAVLSICGDAATWEILQYVFLGTGIAALGAGIALVVLDATDGSGGASAQLRPRLGPTHAGLELVGAW